MTYSTRNPIYTHEEVSNAFDVYQDLVSQAESVDELEEVTAVAEQAELTENETNLLNLFSCSTALSYTGRG